MTQRRYHNTHGLTISQAIRLGCTLTPRQTQWNNIDCHSVTRDGLLYVHTSAMGAAIVAALSVQQGREHQLLKLDDVIYQQVPRMGDRIFRELFATDGLPLVPMPGVFQRGALCTIKQGDRRVWTQPNAEVELHMLLIYLNDGWGWTREEIADYVEHLGY